jgi:Protein of unknown function (DUF2905)
MPQFDALGKWVFFIGLGIAALGGLIWLAGRIPGLNRIGSLPGDIRYTSPDGSFGCYAPIVSMIVISLILTVVVNVVVRLINK